MRLRVLLIVILIFVVVGPAATCSITELCDDDPPGVPRCCSQYGFCGTSADYCGAVCIAGPCWTNITNDPCTVADMCPQDRNGYPQCCSADRLCGNGTQFCGDGCRSGPCIVNSTTTAAATIATTATTATTTTTTTTTTTGTSTTTGVSSPTGNPDDKSCSKIKPCLDPLDCCSQYFFCGNTSEHCGTNCLGGNCNTSAPTVAPGKQCSEEAICIREGVYMCCSKYGHCGLDVQYCGPDCLGGPCWNNASQYEIIAYSHPIANGLGTIVGICTVIDVFALFVIIFKKGFFLRHGAFYCGVITVGVFLSYMAAFISLQRPTDHLCLLFPWLLCISFTLVYGCLFIKTWVVYGIFRRAAKLQRGSIQPFYILKVLSIFLLIEVIILIAWTFVDPPKKFKLKVDFESIPTFEIQCRSKTNIFWYIFLGHKGAWLIFGSILCFISRSMADEYNKSKTIGYAIYNNVMILILGVSLGFVLRDDKFALMVVTVSVIVLSFTFTLLVLNLSIWFEIFYAQFDVVGQARKASVGSYSSKSSFNSNNSQQSQVETDDFGAGSKASGSTDSPSETSQMAVSSDNLKSPSYA